LVETLKIVYEYLLIVILQLLHIQYLNIFKQNKIMFYLVVILKIISQYIAKFTDFFFLSDIIYQYNTTQLILFVTFKR